MCIRPVKKTQIRRLHRIEECAHMCRIRWHQIPGCSTAKSLPCAVFPCFRAFAAGAGTFQIRGFGCPSQCWMTFCILRRPAFEVWVFECVRHRAQVLFVSHLFTRLSRSTFHIEIAPIWVPSSGSPIQEFRFMHIANQTHKKPHLSSLDVAGSSSAPQGPQLHSRLGPNSVSLWNEHGVRVDMPLPEETRFTPTKMSVLGWSTIIIACISTGEEGQIHPRRPSTGSE